MQTKTFQHSQECWNVIYAMTHANLSEIFAYKYFGLIKSDCMGCVLQKYNLYINLTAVGFMLDILDWRCKNLLV